MLPIITLNANATADNEDSGHCIAVVTELHLWPFLVFFVLKRQAAMKWLPMTMTMQVSAVTTSCCANTHSFGLSWCFLILKGRQQQNDCWWHWQPRHWLLLPLAAPMLSPFAFPSVFCFRMAGNTAVLCQLLLPTTWKHIVKIRNHISIVEKY